MLRFTRVFEVSRGKNKGNTTVDRDNEDRSFFSIVTVHDFFRYMFDVDRQRHFPINYQISFCLRTMKEKYT